MSKEIAPHFSASDVSNVKKFSRRKKVFVFNLTFVFPPQNFHLYSHNAITGYDVVQFYPWFKFMSLCFKLIIAAGHHPAADHILERFEIFRSMVPWFDGSINL